MTFDLYIEIAGLCLLYRRSTELLVLLPHTPEGHRHFAVLGSDVKYQPDREPDQGRVEKSCVYHDLGEGHIRFATDPEDGHLETKLDPGYAIHDLTGCSERTVVPDNAFVQVHLPHGQPGTMDPSGAHWKPFEAAAEPVLMATRLSWKVAGLQNTFPEGERAGIAVNITPASGAAYDVVLRPPSEADRTVHMYLYHTLADELPCATLANSDHYEPGQQAPHFSHYFSLLGATHKCEIPTFGHLGDQNSPSGARLAAAVPGQTRQRFVPRAADSGRRFSCMLTTVSDGS